MPSASARPTGLWSFIDAWSDYRYYIHDKKIDGVLPHRAPSILALPLTGRQVLDLARMAGDGVLFIRPLPEDPSKDTVQAPGAIELDGRYAVALMPLSIVASGIACFADWAPKTQDSITVRKDSQEVIQALYVIDRGQIYPPAKVPALSVHRRPLHISEVIRYLEDQGLRYFSGQAVKDVVPSYKLPSMTWRMAYIGETLTHADDWPLVALFRSLWYWLVEVWKSLDTLMYRELEEGGEAVRAKSSPKRVASGLQNVAEMLLRMNACGNCALRRFIDYGDLRKFDALQSEDDKLLKPPTTPIGDPSSLCHFAHVAAACRGRAYLGIMTHLTPDAMTELVRRIDPAYHLGVMDWIRRWRSVDAMPLQMLNSLSGEVAAIAEFSENGSEKFRLVGILAPFHADERSFLVLGRSCSDWAVGVVSGELGARIANASGVLSLVDPEMPCFTDFTLNGFTSNSEVTAFLWWYAVTDILELSGTLDRWQQKMRGRMAYVMRPSRFLETVSRLVGFDASLPWLFIPVPSRMIPVRRVFDRPLAQYKHARWEEMRKSSCGHITAFYNSLPYEKSEVLRALLLTLYPYSQKLKMLIDALRDPKGEHLPAQSELIFFPEAALAVT